MGNIRSLKNAMDFLAFNSKVTHEEEEILNADKIILPGVGSFDVAMDNLEKYSLINTLNIAVFEKQIPLLGICLGMQLLASYGEEGKGADGLGFIDGRVEKIWPIIQDVKIPHIGFNSVHHREDISPNLYNNLRQRTDFYFVHSFHFLPDKEQHVASETDYGGLHVVSGVQRGNVFGTQFHPEKSQSNGLRLLKNFLSI